MPIRLKITAARLLTAVLILPMGWTITGEVRAERLHTPPGAFAKLGPPNTAANLPVGITLTWEPASDAESYSLCIDNTPGNDCDTSWQSLPNSPSFVALGLNSFITYYWQIRAHNLDGETQADGGQWWSFTTGPSSIHTRLPLTLFMTPLPLLNGDFELGPDLSWEEYSYWDEPLIMDAFDLEDQNVDPNGDWAAWLGFTEDEISILSQKVSIPRNASTLHYVYQIRSTDSCGNDFARVTVYPFTVAEYNLCRANRVHYWQEANIDLSSIAGWRVTLEFKVTTNADLPSSFFLDDVEFR